MSQSTVSQWERGVTEPRAEQLRALDLVLSTEAEAVSSSASLSVALTKAQVVDARRRARVSAQAFAEVTGHYPNTLSRHFTGKLGEIGTETWLGLQGLSVDAVFRNPTRLAEPDLKVGKRGIEVKSWRAHNWAELGRCVDPAQLLWIRTRAVAILWCVVEEGPQGVEVRVAGWSTPDEVGATKIVATGPMGKRNHQVSLTDMHEPSELLSLLHDGQRLLGE